jgi:hypothetical protein
MWAGRYDYTGGYVRFFLMILSHNTLANYYQTNFSLMQYHKYSLSDIETMVPWERDIYVKMLVDYLEKLEEESKRR